MMMKSKLVLTLALCGLLWACDGQSQPKPKPPSERQATAQAMFAERCKTAGEKIYKTVENVEGIFLMKLRPKKINFGNQFEMDDPYGRDAGGDGYIENFLFGRTVKGSLSPKDVAKQGYRYVEAIDPQDGKRSRYTGSVKEVTHTSSLLIGGDGKTVFKAKEFVLDRTPATGPAPHYGVTYDDISTHEDREYWIAGGRIQVIDLKTNEVIAERIGYMMDWAQGSNAGNRSPWLLAERNACPAFPVAPGGHPVKMDQTRNFVEKVLTIAQD